MTLHIFGICKNICGLRFFCLILPADFLLGYYDTSVLNIASVFFGLSRSRRAVRYTRRRPESRVACAAGRADSRRHNRCSRQAPRMVPPACRLAFQLQGHHHTLPKIRGIPRRRIQLGRRVLQRNRPGVCARHRPTLESASKERQLAGQLSNGLRPHEYAHDVGHIYGSRRIRAIHGSQRGIYARYVEHHRQQTHEPQKAGVRLQLPALQRGSLLQRKHRRHIPALLRRLQGGASDTQGVSRPQAEAIRHPRLLLLQQPRIQQRRRLQLFAHPETQRRKLHTRLRLLQP